MVDFLREKTLSVRDLAALVGVTPKTIYMWSSPRRDGKPRLETVKVGGKRMSSIEALQRFGQQNDAEVVSLPMSTPINKQGHDAAMQMLRDQHGF